MATNTTTVSVTECPVCKEDFKQPKLLPCNHSYCLQCLKTLTDETKKITCPECRSEVPVPERGVRGFTDNRYVEDLLKMKKTHQCMKHFLPLHLFCDNVDCQKQICPSCAAVKHTGHKIIELEDKAESVKAEMSKTKENVREISLSLGSHLDQLNETINKVNSSTSESLNKIDEARAELHKRVQELYEKTQAEIELRKIELLQNQTNILKELNKATEDTSNSKLQFDELYMGIEKSMTSMSNNEIVKDQGTLDEAFLQMKVKELANKSYEVDTNTLLYTKPDLPSQLKIENHGKLCPQPITVHSPDKLKESIPQNLDPQATPMKTISTEFEMNNQTNICISQSGHLVTSGKIETSNYLKCLSPDGNSLWEINMGSDDTDRIKGLCFLKTDKEYLILSINNRIELREVNNGKLMAKFPLGFDPRQVCALDDKSFVVCSLESVIKILKFDITGNNQKIKPNRTIITDMKDVESLIVIKHQGKQLLVLAAWFPDPVIEAVDFESGTVQWKITGEYEGVQIRPHGVCGDNFGNLFIGDTTHKRVLLASPEGAIKKLLVTLPGSTRCTAWDKSRRRLAVSYQGDNEVIAIFEIQYVTK